MDLIEHVEMVAETAKNTGKALALPADFYGMNRYTQHRMLQDAQTVLIEYYLH